MDVDARISIISSSGSSASDYTHDFNSQELILLRQLQGNLQLFESVKESLIGRQQLPVSPLSPLSPPIPLSSSAARSPLHVCNCHGPRSTLVCLEMHQTLWFLPHGQKERLVEFILDQVQMSLCSSTITTCRESLLSRYLNCHMFTELSLDGIFKYGDDNTLPSEIFKCQTVRRLSLKYNYLDRIPADIGRMSNLEYLALTNNKLQNKSIPYALTFCCQLRTLMLDNNLLDALPGFLLKMSSLEMVHRHGNHNYFKSTFMWYHTDVNERILAVPGSSEFLPPSIRRPRSLQFWCAKSIIGSKMNFFNCWTIAPAMCDFIASIYSQFNVCGCCNKAKLADQPGYKVITFKNPYLGNTCVPFQHWACSLSCAMALEIPAREEQIAAARELDRQYDTYIRECQRQYLHSASTGRRGAAGKLLCAGSRQRRSSPQSSSFRHISSESLTPIGDPVAAVDQLSVSQSAVSTTSCFGRCQSSCCVC